VPRPPRLEPAEVERRLAGLPGWSRRDDALHRELVFADFSAAWGFMSRGALEAERLGHHPDWCNSWNRVIVRLSTHDQGGITELDFELARRLEALAVAAGGRAPGA
jgi:4a-hydroxytetrahydrobiopterin dehydratase